MHITKEPHDFLSLLPATGLPEYLDSFSNCIETGYIINEDCILPFLVRKRSIFKYIQLTTPVIGVKNSNEEKEFLDQAINFLKKKNNAIYITSSATSIFNAYPEGSLQCKFGSYILNLEKTEEDLFASLHSKHRNVIRNAQKHELNVLHGKEYLKDCFDLINQTFSRQGSVGITLETVQNLNSLGHNISYTIVKYGDEIQGCAIFLWKKNDRCYYLHGGSSKRPYTGAINLLHWETILRMKKNDVLLYDFVGGRLNPDKGSKLEGIQRFKSRFGGEFFQGYLWKYIFSNFKYIVFSFVLSLYFRLVKGIKYEGDAIDQERKRGNY